MAEIASSEEFDKKVESFGKLVAEKTKTYGRPVREDRLQSSMRHDNDLKFSYRDLETYASSNGIDIQSHLADKGIIEIMWYDQPVPRPDADALAKWEAKTGRVPIDDLKSKNKDAKFVEFEEEFQHYIEQDKLATISMLEKGDSVEFNLDEELIYFCDRSIGRFLTDKPDLAKFIKEPATYGIIGKVYAEIASVKKGKAPSFILHIYYAIDEARRNVKNGLLLSEDGKAIVECIDDVSDLVIPEGVERIEDKAFMNCPVASVKFPESLRYIGDYAFGGTNLKSIVVPKWIDHIGISPFTFGPKSPDSRRSDLFLGDYFKYYAEVEPPTYVEVEEGNEKYFSRGGSLFERNEDGISLVTLYYRSATTSPHQYSYKIPDFVTHLKKDCIIRRASPFSVDPDIVLPSGIKRVDKGAISREVRVMNVPENLEFGQDEIWNRLTRCGRSLSGWLDKDKYRDVAVSENNPHYFRSRECCFMHSPEGYETSLALGSQDSVTVKVEDMDQLSSVEKAAVASLRPNDVIGLQLTFSEYDECGVSSLSLRVSGLYDIGNISVESLFDIKYADENDLQAAIDNLDCRVESVEVTPSRFGLEDSVSLSVTIKKAVK